MLFSGLTTAAVVFEIYFFFKEDDEEVPAIVLKFISLLSLKPCRKGQQDVEEAEEKPEISRTSKNVVSVSINGKPKPNKQTKSNETQAEEKKLTWKQVIKTMDKFLFFAFLGAEFFFTLCFLAPLFSS